MWLFVKQISDFNQHYSMPHRHIKVLLVTLFQSGYFTAPPVKVEKLQPYKVNVGRAYVYGLFYQKASKDADTKILIDF